MHVRNQFKKTIVTSIIRKDHELEKIFYIRIVAG